MVGIRDASLSEQLQLDAVLTLDKAKKTILQREAVHEQNQSLKEVDKTQAGALDELRYKQKHSKKPKSDKGRANTKGGSSKHLAKQCTHCGNGSRTRDKCPAIDATCH